MKQTINQYQFADQFSKIRPDNFSRAALFALFDYYTEVEEDSGEELEFDPIAICCDWSEYPSALVAAEDFGFEPNDDDDDNEEAALEWLRENTQVIGLGIWCPQMGAGGSVIVLSF
jgi:hypothetical protein